MSEYTGRVIGIISDPHGLFEPTKAALEDMASQGITEIYSLGDNIGEGPNPGEVIELLNQYGVKSVAGNSEEYAIIGTKSFGYLDAVRKQSCLWTLSKLNEKQIGQIRLFPHTIELMLGGKKLALVHFANDVRFDYHRNSTWSYQRTIRHGGDGFKQFLRTNSDGQQEEIERNIKAMGESLGAMKGYFNNIFKYDAVDNELDRMNYLFLMILNETDINKRKNYFNEFIDISNYIEKRLSKDFRENTDTILELFSSIVIKMPYLSAKVDPLLFGHTISMYDAIVQGHVHFKMYEESDKEKFITVRAVGMAYGKDDPVDCAAYTILRETTDGYEVEERLVKYDRESMVTTIQSCNIPDRDKIERFVQKRV
jgi:predicted phosphodiesterase